MSKVSNITLFMLVDLTNEFLKYFLYLQTFFARASTSLQLDIYDFKKKLFDLINFFQHELPKNHFPNSILRNIEYPTV